MTALFRDIRYAVRGLARSPTFTTIAIVTLALGIGANTAIFSVVNSVFLHPLPFDAADRMFVLWETNPDRSEHKEHVSAPNFLDWREQCRTINLAAWTHWEHRLISFRW